MATKNLGIDVNYGLVIKQTVTTETLVWAVYYLMEVKDVPAKKISKTMLNNFLKEQMSMFGHNGDSLYGSSYNEDEIDDETYKTIENVLNRIFFGAKK